MISPNDIQVTKVDLTLFATFLTVANVVQNLVLKTPLFAKEWMTSSVAMLLGVALHGLLTNKVSAMANSALNVANPGVRQAVYDIVKFGTIFTTQKVVSSMIEGRPVVFDRRWMMESGLTTAGFALFDLIQSRVPRVGTMQPLVDDLIKVSMGTLLANYVVDGTLNQTHLIKLGSVLVGFAAFHLGTKRLVVPSEQFTQMGGISIQH